MRKILIIAFTTLLMGLAVPAYAQSDDQNCADFTSQAAAQRHLDADKSDPDRLDADHDGKACEDFPGPWKKNPPESGKPVIVVNENNCEAFSAQVTDLAPGDKVRFQFGHDIVRFVTVTEQDTAASFTLSKGEAPEGDWGFSVRVNDQEISDQIVTVKACSAEGGAAEGPLPFTGSHTPLLLTLGLGLLLVGFAALLKSRSIS